MTFFVIVVKFMVNFSAAFRNEHGSTFHAAYMVDFVGDMILFDFLTGNSAQTYQRYIQVAKFLISRSNKFDTNADFDRRETGAGTVAGSYLDNGTSISGWT